MQSGRVLCGIKGIEQSFALEEISPIAKIFEETDQSLEGYNGVAHDKLLEILPPMKDNLHHGTFILYSSKDPFLPKKSAKDDNSKFFKSISPTISTWVQHVLQSMPSSISSHTLEDFLHGSKPMNYESMMYMYGWIIEAHQPITFLQVEIAQDYIVHHSLDWNSRMSFFKEGGTDGGRQSQKFKLNSKPDPGLGRPKRTTEYSDRSPDNRG